MSVEYKDLLIFSAVLDEDKYASKAAIAREYNVSPRTVGRAFDRVVKDIVNNALYNYPNVSALAASYGLFINDVREAIDYAVDNGEKFGVAHTQRTELVDFLNGVHDSYSVIVNAALATDSESHVMQYALGNSENLIDFDEYPYVRNALDYALNHPQKYDLTDRYVDHIAMLTQIEDEVIIVALSKDVRKKSDLFDMFSFLDESEVYEILRQAVIGDNLSSSELNELVRKFNLDRNDGTVIGCIPRPDEECCDNEYDPNEIDDGGHGEPEPEVEDADEDGDDFTYEIIGSSRSITITRSDGETRSLESSNRLFPNVLEIVKSGLDNETLARAFSEMSFTEVLTKFSDGALLIDCEARRVVMYPDTPHEVTFTNALAEKLLAECYDNIDGTEFISLTSFAKKLALAGSDDVIAELFDFVSATDIKIDEDGYVICWKKVRDDYKDIYSGTFDNSPGQVCEIPAHTVDTDRTRTCSTGLHVCSKSYLPHFGARVGEGSRVVKVRVNPRDFIAIPTDYGNAKARVSSYEVLEDVTEEFYDV